MGCYVIVTCLSMLWTGLTVLTTLTTFYCLASTDWLVGYARPYNNHDNFQIRIANQSISETGTEHQYNMMSKNIPEYSPTIGLFSRCLRLRSGTESILSCAPFASNIGQNNDSFPIAWQVSFVLSGIACTLLLFTMMCSILSLCVRDFCRKSLFTITGLIQVISGLILSIAIAIYPAGWSSMKVKYFCGKEAAEYNINECTIGWAYIVIILCTIGIFTAGMLSINADRATSKDKIEDEILEGKHLICVT